MARTFKSLGQSAPSATTLTDIYTVPTGGQCVGSTIVICNRSATPTSYRISVAVAGAADTNKQYIAYDTPIGGNQSFPWTIGFTLGAGDIIRVYATLATLSFNAFGTEIT